MESFGLDRYGPVKTALKELGLTVDFIEQQAQKTVITVSPCEKSDKSRVSAEKQGANINKGPKG